MPSPSSSPSTTCVSPPSRPPLSKTSPGSTPTPLSSGLRQPFGLSRSMSSLPNTKAIDSKNACFSGSPTKTQGIKKSVTSAPENSSSAQGDVSHLISTPHDALSRVTPMSTRLPRRSTSSLSSRLGPAIHSPPQTEYADYKTKSSIEAPHGIDHTTPSPSDRTRSLEDLKKSYSKPSATSSGSRVVSRIPTNVSRPGTAHKSLSPPSLKADVKDQTDQSSDDTPVVQVAGDSTPAVDSIEDLSTPSSIIQEDPHLSSTISISNSDVELNAVPQDSELVQSPPSKIVPASEPLVVFSKCPGDSDNIQSFKASNDAMISHPSIEQETVLLEEAHLPDDAPPKVDQDAFHTPQKIDTSDSAKSTFGSIENSSIDGPENLLHNGDKAVLDIPRVVADILSRNYVSVQTNLSSYNAAI